MLTQWHLLPLVTSRVKLLFTHVHSGQLSLASRLHWCPTNHSHSLNIGWTFSSQTSCLYVCVCGHTHTYLFPSNEYSSVYVLFKMVTHLLCCTSVPSSSWWAYDKNKNVSISLLWKLALWRSEVCLLLFVSYFVYCFIALARTCKSCGEREVKEDILALF